MGVISSVIAKLLLWNEDDLILRTSPVKRPLHNGGIGRYSLRAIPISNLCRFFNNAFNFNFLFYSPNIYSRAITIN